MFILKLLPGYYRGDEIILLDFISDRVLEMEVRKVKGIRWSHQHRKWYLLLSRDSYELLKSKLGGNIEIDTSAIRSYLEQKNVLKPVLGKEVVSKARAELLIQYPLCLENLKAFKSFQEKIVLKGYSK